MKKNDVQEYLNFGKSLILKCGYIAKEKFNLTHQEIKIKSDNSIATDVDSELELLIKKTIKETYPNHQVLGEENGLSGNASDYQWVIDPLDGTSNYANKIPFFCVSIALLHKGQTIIGLVYNPILDELFYAGKDLGGFLDCQGASVPLKPTTCLNLSMAIVSIKENYKEKEISKNITFRGTRKLGSTALEMCFVASGRLDAYYTYNAQIWDIAAAKLICEEVGLIVTVLGSPIQILVSNTALEKPLKELIK